MAGRPLEALPLLQEALLLEPEVAVAWEHLGLVFRAGGRALEAEASLRHCLELEPDRPSAWANLALVLVEADRGEEGLLAADQALALDPELVGAWCQRGLALRALGRPVEAAASLREALARAPDLVPAWIGLLEVDPTVDPSAAISLADYPNLDDRLRISLLLRVAALYEQENEVSLAWQWLRRANLLRQRRWGPPPMEQRRARYQALRDIPDAWLRAAPIQNTGGRRILVVGLPRSGTTLVHRLLAGAQGVRGLGEDPLLHGFVADPAAPPGEAALAELAQSYAGPPEQVSLTKLPADLERLWLLSRISPDATVVCCHRDPEDQALSLLLHDFAVPMPWATDPAAIRQEQAEAADLVEHWRKTLPLRWVDISYEGIVADPEAQAAALHSATALHLSEGPLLDSSAPSSLTAGARSRAEAGIYSDRVGRGAAFRALLRLGW